MADQRFTKKIGIVYRKDSDAAFSAAKKLIIWLKQNQIQSFVQTNSPPIEGAVEIVDTKQIESLDLVVVLGGDGTYLQAVRMLHGRQKPILGVNLGSLGFLTETRIEDLEASIKLALAGQLNTRPRAMLAAKVQLKGGVSRSFIALNDVVVERGASSQLIRIVIECDGQLVSEFSADGVIVASPTGSTAYNLAAGGPVLHPEVNAIVVTPINPHSLTLRPFVFPDVSRLSLKLIQAGRQAQVAIDGQVLEPICDQSEIVIEKSTETHLALRKPGHNFFQLLREKLKFGERS